jgi:NADH-quinone oxidoreductase subunit N
MSAQDFFMLSPLLILACSSVVILLLITLKLSHRFIQLSSISLFTLAFVSLVFIQNTIPHTIAPLIIIDGFSVFIMGLIIFASIVVTILSYIYFEEREENPKEYYVLLFVSTLGACVLAVSQHFISLFLGLEILTIGLYTLIAYLRTRKNNIEAGIKYLILAAFSSAFLLFGMALIYLQTGSMEFSLIAQSLASAHTLPPLFLTGLGMMLVGLGFKLAVVPFHMWTADVYQGAPAPVTAFIATASKGAVLAVLLRFFMVFNGFNFNILVTTLIVIAIASMLIGNLLALQQKNVKRILAYSSIAHLGYLLVAFVPGSRLSIEAVNFYLLAYFITTLTAFGIITVLSDKESDAEDIDTYTALFWRKPVLACIFTAALLSLAGIPLTAGFIGKFYILSAGLQGGYWIAALVLIVSSVIGLYYYLRIVTAMFSGYKSISAIEKKKHPVFYLFSSITLSILTLLIVWFGIYPTIMMRLIEQYLR